MKAGRAAGLAWAWCALAIGLMAYGLAQSLRAPGAALDALNVADQVLTAGFVVVFDLVGALIVSRLPRNTIGWLMMFMGLSIAFVSVVLGNLGQTRAAPAAPTSANLVSAWLNSWAWWLLIGPLLLIPLLFPTGRPPSPRWCGVILSLGVTFSVFLIIATFGQTLQSADGAAVFANPVGFLPDGLVAVIMVPWEGLLLINVVLCVSALFVRFRRASPIERQQIKWVLLACAVFLVTYALGFVYNLTVAGSNAYGPLFDIAILLIPLAIGVAILRYRLWDIDIIIRRTLVYAVLTGLLALAYFGSVLLLQGLFGLLTGQRQSVLVTVLSTLVIAALFVPLRRRVQAVIDQRFYRRKYDAAQTLAAFAAALRTETNLETLTARLVEVVDITLQPEVSGLWLMPAANRPAEQDQQR